MGWEELLAPLKERKFLYFLYAWALLVLFGVFGYFFWSRDQIVAGVTVAGEPLGGMKFDTAYQLLEERLAPKLEQKLILGYRDRSLTVIPGAVGIKFDIGSTVKQAYLLGRSGSIWSRLSTRVKVTRRGMELMPIFAHNRATLDSFYRLLDAIIAVEPVRAVLIVKHTGEVHYTPGRVGRAINHRKLTKALEEAVCGHKGGEIEIPVEPVIPPLTEADVKTWRLDEILGIYSTKFNPEDEDRTQNIRTACNAIDNKIVYPGQSFSFNTWVGPRVSEAGYKEAPVILRGKLVPGMGGGICQASTTLYNAVLLGGLKVLQRTNHSIPSPYVPMGQDATVVYGGTDFVFENNFSMPVLIAARVEPPYVTVALLGQKLSDETITFETVVKETLPFSTREVIDPALAKGARIKVQPGRKGYKTELWRVATSLDGRIRREMVNTSIYPAQPEEYKIGSKP